MTTSPLRRVAGTRPLLFHDGVLFCSRYDRIVSTADFGLTFQAEGRIDAGATVPLEPVVCRAPLAQRVLRASVYRMRILPDGNRVYLFRGGVYTQPTGTSRARLTWTDERGSRPVSLAFAPSGPVVFGEYWSNPDRLPVRIFGSHDGGLTWRSVHTFRDGAIRHVHGISYDEWEHCFWICTGDYGSENRLIRASLDFSEMEVVRQGGQSNRFCSTLLTPDHLITATDTPLEENFVCVLHKATGEFRRVVRIENSNFYSCLVDGRVYVSTNCEPSKRNDDRQTHVWSGAPSGEDWRHVLAFPADIFYRLAQLPLVPGGLFQYPRVFFPEGNNPGGVLICQPMGVRRHADEMLVYDTANWWT